MSAGSGKEEPAAKRLRAEQPSTASSAESDIYMPQAQSETHTELQSGELPPWRQLENQIHERLNHSWTFDLSGFANDPAALKDTQDMLDFSADKAWLDLKGVLCCVQGMPKPRPRVTPEQKRRREYQMKLSSAAFGRDFKGTALFSDLMKHLQHQGTSYWIGCARIMPIIQSSGTGKSRAMHEAAAEFFTFPMVLRDPHPLNAGFPRGSPDLFDLLCDRETLDGLHDNEARVKSPRKRVLAVLLGMLQVCAQWLDNDAQLSKPQVWRDKLYGPDSNGYADFFKEVKDIVDRIENEQACTEDALETSVVSNFKTLSDRLAPPSNTNTILFHVDEGHQLQRGVTISALRSVFTVLETRIPEHLVVLTSTASELIEPAPSTDAWHVQSSDRFPQRTKNGLIQPWCYLPVNVDLHAASFEMPEFNESDTFEQEVDKSRKARAHLPKTPTARVVRSFQHQIMIGRPLWNSYYKVEKSHKDTLSTAYLKLSGHNGEAGNESAYARRAAVICRLALRPSQTMTGQKLGEKLVDDHMARALYVSRDRSQITVAYTVEPILGYAASKVMRYSPTSCLKEVLTMVESRLIEKSMRGELLTKLAFMLAFDKASHLLDTGGQNSQLFSSASLLLWLSHLSGRSVDELSQVSAMDTSQSVRTLGDIGHATCVLAQFIKTEGSARDVSDYTIYQSIYTSAGIEAPPLATDVDILFAGVIDEDAVLEPCNIVLVFGQSSNYKEPADSPHPTFDIYRKRGYTVIHILHESGGVGPFSFDIKTPPSHKSTRQEEEGIKQGALFVFRMVGIHDKLASSADCDSIAARERDRYPGYDEATVRQIQDQMPMLFNDENCLAPTASLGCDFI